MEFIKEIYAYEYQGIVDDVHLYSFVSVVKGREITKVVSIKPTGPYPNLYNLGFGNLEEKENGEKFVNDSSDNNNNDFDKVLASVFACLMHFLNFNEDARILFFGNTEHKHILYKRKIAANLEALQEIFLVHGGFAEYEVQIRTEVREIVRRGIKRKRNVKVKDVETLKIKQITDTELFNVEKAKKYDFVLISLGMTYL